MDDADFLQCPFHFVQGAAFRQDVGYHLEVGQALVFQGSVVRLVFAIAGKVEESGGKTFLVDSFHHEFLLFYRHSHVPVLAPELDPVHSRGSERLEFLVPGNHYIHAVHDAFRPFDGTCRDDGTVLAFEGDARAGTGWHLRHDADACQQKCG